ncbi:MAG: YbjN domain-containing protein [Alphaproteobacteria bacterium]|nr:YbjN domain-containing protein [Alphaproteobacteria bacterium]
MPLHFDTIDEEASNPLDNVEFVLDAHNWVFNRMNDDELMVNVTGKSGQYRLFFIWQEDMQALQFCAQYDLHITTGNRKSALQALRSMNENLWMGHFDLPDDTGVPTYRYTCLFRGIGQEGITETIEDIVDISLAQCERHYPAFTMLSTANDFSGQSLSLALMDTLGES